MNPRAEEQDRDPRHRKHRRLRFGLQVLLALPLLAAGYFASGAYFGLVGKVVFLNLSLVALLLLYLGTCERRGAASFALLLSALFLVLFVSLVASFSIAAPINQSLILAMRYGPEVVRARGLEIVDTRPDLVVSNGDVLPSGYHALYVFLQTVLGGLGTACPFVALWALDKRLCSGRATALLRDRIAAINEGARAARLRQINLTSPAPIADRIGRALELKPSRPVLLVTRDRKSKFSAVLEAYDFLRSSGCLTVVLFQFPSERRAFLDFCAHRADEFCLTDGPDFRCTDNRRASVGTADLVLGSPQVEDRVLPPDEDVVCILGDCHPLWEKDDKVAQSLSEPSNVRAVFQLVSTDEAPMHYVRPILDRVWSRAAGEGPRYLEHSLVSSLVKKGRRPYRRKAISDVPASTAEEWIHVNCRK